MPVPLIEISLATYNGAAFLPEQLASLFAQSCDDFTILAADDGSTDGTVEILDRAADEHPGRLRRLAFDGAAGGVAANFARLIDALSADYAMFCDQDDVWLPHKIEATLAAMRAAEAEHGAGTPILCFSDLQVVNEDLQPIAPSLWAYTGVDPAATGLNRLLLTTVTTGCTIMMNRALYERARPLPYRKVRHDAWMALTASAFGHIVRIDEPLILYRQHRSNVSGARRWWGGRIIRRAAGVFDGENAAILSRKARRAGAFLERFGEDLSPGDRETVRALAEIWARPRLARPRELLSRDMVMPQGIATLGLLLTLLVSRSGRTPDTA